MSTSPLAPAPAAATPVASAVEAPVTDVRDAAARRALLARRLRERASRPSPLAPHQERLAVLQELEPGSAAYAVPLVLRLDGPLDLPALSEALRRLPDRHAWLRSRVERRGADLLQVVDPAARVEPQVREVPGADEADPRVRAFVEALATTPFDLAAGPPWRAGLAVCAPDRAVLALVVHHVACDAASLDVLLADLGAHYDAAAAGIRAALPRPVAPQDVADRLRALAAEDGAAEAVAARVAALARTQPDARLAADARVLPPAGGDAEAGGHGGPGPAASAELRLDPGTSAALAAAAEDLGVTPFALVAAAVGAATSRFTGAEGPVLGVPVDLRPHVAGSEETVAFLVETAAVGLPGVLDASLADAARRVAAAVVEALDRPVGLDAVVAGLRAAGQLPPTGTPLHTYLSWVADDDDSRLGRTGPAVTVVDAPGGTAKFDLAWTGSTGPAGVTLALEYDARRLSAATAGRLLDAAVGLLAAGLRAPHVPLGDLPLPPAEAAALAAAEGIPGAEPSTGLLPLLLDAVGAAGAADPARPVVTASVSATGAPVTAAVLRDRVDALAAVLVARGVAPGDRVLVSGRRTAGTAAVLLAVLRAGAAFVPVDPAAPRARAVATASQVGARAVVGAPGWAEALAAAVDGTAVPVDDDGRAPGPAAAAPAAWPARGPGDLAYVMVTSGSTGTPKGVAVTDGAVVARIDSYRTVLADSGVVLLAHSPLGFDASIWMLWALAVGGRLVVPADAEAADPGTLARLVRAGGVTDAFFVPSLYEPLLQAADPDDLASLRRVFVGGEPFPPPLAGRHVAALPGTELLNVYGPTETVVTATAHRVAGPTDGPVPIGHPHPGTVAAVLDRAGRRVPLGVPGELHLGGPAVALRYVGREDETGGPFSVRTGPDGRPVRWYATGDVVRRREDGEIVFLGRRDRQVKVSGQRVELGEVEAALRRCPGVVEAAVEAVGVGAAKHLVAVLVPATAGQAPAVRAAARGLLPAAWVPEVWVGLPALPRLASGKLDRAALREAAAAARRDARGDASAGTPGAGPGRGEPDPGSFTQKAVLAAARALLGRDDVGLDDDFFAVGGSSLLAARLVGALAERLGVEVPLSLLAADARLRRVAALVDDAVTAPLAESHDGVRLVPLRETGSRAPLVVVARDGDSSLLLRHLLPRLAPDRPVLVALRPAPPLGPARVDLAEHGRRVADALRAAVPAGPVHVLGHSASGVVALETARALGDRRGACVLLDTDAPDRPRPVAGPVVDLAREARMRLWFRRRKGVRLGRLAREAGGAPPDPAVVRAVRYYQESRAMDRARPAPVGFPVALVSAGGARRTSAEGAADLGWAAWCRDLRLFAVDGDHHTMLMEPHVTGTGAALDAVLRDLP